METRKESLSAMKVCRFCLSQDDTLCSLYDKNQGPRRSIPFTLKILSSVSIEVFPSDKMPSYICSRCKFFVSMCHDYKQVFRDADESILRFIQNGTALEPISWPSSLTKLFRLSNKAAPKPTVMKTVVEGGATIEVTQSQDASETDDDEDVYNVKIDDGSNEGASACVKIVTSKDDTKDNKNKKDSEFESDSHSKLNITGGCWACDECEATYPLHQLLELHKIQRHRGRSVECGECHAKFLSKYNLATHLLQHSEQSSRYECNLCEIKFKRPYLLRRHEKLTHPDLLVHNCRHCPEIFISEEKLKTHVNRQHNRDLDRTYKCVVCEKKFNDRSSLENHTAAVHSTSPDLSCEYCPERFNSVSKLARHVRTHAGERPYPCKYCDKTFTKSHHYTRHVRLKHSDSSNFAKVSFGVTDAYQCEQCTASFRTQDELIYHSAIHATQNLTCPLCQEKFHDVDAVTAHIKSHVPDMEYQCDFCELVFTSKDKLDLHLISVHEAELRDQDPVESSEMDADDDEDESLNVKQEGDDMVIEIKKPDEFMLTNPRVQELQNIEDKLNSTNSEGETESEPSMPLPMVDPMDEDVDVKPDIELRPTPAPAPAPIPTPAVPTTVPKLVPSPARVVPTTAATPTKTDKVENSQTAVILRIAEEIKRKTTEPATPPEKKDKQKAESSGGGASDKSLRLLEKELQELQRTNTRNDVSKTLSKPIESLRNRRPQMHTSTPKLRSSEEKKTQSLAKSSSFEKKMPERRAVKENKKPEETKEVKTNSIAKEDKDVKESKVKDREEKESRSNVSKEEKESRSNVSKEEKESRSNISKEETKEKVVKNGNNKSSTEEGVRRSSRPSKIKDYAKMIRDKPDSGDSDDDTDFDDEEYNISKESEKSTEVRTKVRKSAVKPKPQTPAQTPKTTPARKRGRPRKEPPPEIPAKIRKDDSEDDNKPEKPVDTEDSEKEDKTLNTTRDKQTPNVTPSKQENVEKKAENVLVAPTGQTLKKVPIKALPPGIKPLPLPTNARPVGTTETCEMQIGKKVVKVQKIVMTKAEVEAMAKKGLLEMKDGTMVLKQGIKLPTSDPVALKSTLVGEDLKESSVKATPTRCSIGDA